MARGSRSANERSSLLRPLSAGGGSLRWANPLLLPPLLAMPIETSGKLVGAEQMGALARRRRGKQGCSGAGMRGFASAALHHLWEGEISPHLKAGRKQRAC